MKFIIALLLSFSVKKIEAQNGCTPCIMHGKDCVVLNVTSYSATDGESKVYKFGGYDTWFDSKAECERYYQYNYGHYPFYDDFIRHRGWIETKYHCVSCIIVYADQIKKAKEKKEIASNKIGGNSRNANAEIAKTAKGCFDGDDNAYRDFLNATSKIADDIYLDNISCKNGVFFPEWSKRDVNGNKIPVGDNERKSIDDFYKEMKDRAKSREINKLMRQIQFAQSAKEAKELITTIHELIRSNSGSEKVDISALSPKPPLSEKNGVAKASVFNNVQLLVVDTKSEYPIKGLKISNPDGTTCYFYDTDGDMKIDESVKQDANGKIVRDYNVNLNTNPVNAMDDQYSLDWLFQIQQQGLKPGGDGYITHVENSKAPFLNGNLPRNYFMNGVLNNYKDALESATKISELTGSNIELIHNQTQGLAADLFEARQFYKGMKSVITEQAAKFIALDLAANREVRLFAHSEGAAISYSSVTSIKSALKAIGAPDSKIEKLAIITLGGYSPETKAWPSGVNVINIENNYDLVPFLARSGANIGVSDKGAHIGNISLKVHPVKYYYKWIKIFSNPNLKLKPYKGRTFSTSDLYIFK